MGQMGNVGKVIRVVLGIGIIGIGIFLKNWCCYPCAHCVSKDQGDDQADQEYANRVNSLEQERQDTESFRLRMKQEGMQRDVEYEQQETQREMQQMQEKQRAQQWQMQQQQWELERQQHLMQH